ncbi:ComEC family competence protein [Aliishimia ponticola]|uniref:ComEC family competence protein n=1 Tax=Aliishimia ponticola TaxID=2499833 RepID=A0A4S4NGR8_9RHOB|nr:ComEC/Rec2 family competence protein [Aliishimia ponticola]THH38856.1 ComEC family competence protein [Aliishimia ponticola]
MGLLAWLAGHLQAQRGMLLPWVPVCYGIGIAIYFAQPVEPSREFLWALAGAGLICAAIAQILRGSATAILLTGATFICAGVPMAGWRAHDVAAPVLGWRYYGPVEGRVVAIDRSASDAVRLTLDRLRMGKIPTARTPERVRISLHGDAAGSITPMPGQRIMTTAHVSPPGGPVEPGGFDFQRHSWFLKLGGVGYTRVPIVQAGPPDISGWRMRVFTMRMAVSHFVRDILPGDIGGFAAAVTSGDRSGMGQAALEDLRASNLAHLLAISGLHMGLLTGFVFAVLRFGLVLVPGVALHWPVRAIAAAGALVAGAGYLALSGGNVSTERAFIMAAVALGAVMLNRRAISLRSVAIAAMIVLSLRPEAMLGPGFQMSFAATAGLVAVFNALRDAPWRLPRWVQPVSAVVISSAVAGLATAPFSAAHFNAVSHYGLFANVLSVPVMGALVVPAAVLAACLAPIGLAAPALWVMGWGLEWILFVAQTTANFPGARSFVVGPSAWVLPCLTLGLVVIILWQGRLRWIGVGPVAAALMLWSVQERPAVLISDTGGLVGVMTAEGRALSRARGSGFVATNWLENDGDGGDQAAAHARWAAEWPAEEGSRAARAALAGVPLWHVTGKKAAAAAPDCTAGILVSNQPVPRQSPDCALFDPDRLKSTGAVALYLVPGGQLVVRTARDVAGERLWSQWPDAAPRHAAVRALQYVRISPTKRP